jgi:flagellar hook-associated protein 3 FlgL
VRGLIDDVDAAHAQVADAYGALGGRTKLLEMVRNRITDVQMNLDEQSSQVEDADLTQVITDFSSAQNALQAGLQAGAKVMQQTLLDYLH